MINYLLAVVILLIVGLAVGYIIKEKKSGNKCIGCPNAKKCSGHCSADKANIYDDICNYSKE